ncbi:protein-L-isoaspartate carboxylmethyltransferase [Phycicoccus sp. CSK15P-2]|uniref:protein-L-isoaspartate O-methyltransferase family protein n=1 Tax=Phycicoccus sp. CSK15P-2 TaxID=2807627 RepID=UPI00194E7657|nr:methyltransferase domain-containing protein [Phycicoccus sp. CSK15P-2]MBM6404682.1 protein-L-isoaspartate carboxylmethyltransferase [Phycicoccus sp. CSK15P-2]
MPGPDALDIAFAAHPREHFLPRAVVAEAGTDGPLSIGYGQTNSQPRTVRAMLELLDVRPGHRVLDVGAGSGWTTALLAELTGSGGVVIGVERVPQLVERAAAAVGGALLGWASVRSAQPGRLGAPDDGPFNRILVSAMAETLPTELVAQLTPGGVLVVPVAGRMLRVVRGEQPDDDPAAPSVTEHGTYRFVPLVSD